MVNYNFEWDPNKAKSNRDKHGLSFEETATVFRDPMAFSIFDDEHSTNDERWVTIGISNMEFVEKIAKRKNIEIQTVVNQLLKGDIKIAEVMQ